MNDVLSDHLKSLHTAAIDARNGYREALDDAGGKRMTPLFKEMIALHSAHADELRSELQKLGEEADQSGSFMTNVHRTIVSIRALFNGLDDSVLPGLIDGEERNVSHYNDVLNAPSASGDEKKLLVAERGGIEAAISRMHAADK